MRCTSNIFFLCLVVFRDSWSEFEVNCFDVFQKRKFIMPLNLLTTRNLVRRSISCYAKQEVIEKQWKGRE